MANRYRTESTLSARGQTAIPSSIRTHLGLESGEVVIRPKLDVDEVASIEEDPALRPFLSLLEQDIQQKPEQLEPMGSDFIAVAIAIAGSWENIINFDSGGFDFTDDDVAELSELFAEIDAEEAQH